MTENDIWQGEEKNRYQARLLGHGALVLLIGLISGVILIFSMLKGFVLWPILDIPYELPGSVRGWKAAHVGGITNGLLLMGVALAIVHLPLSYASTRFVFWSMVLTGWGNTLFYWGGNLAPSRGISVLDNDYGQSNMAGVVAFVGGGSAMLFTIISAGIIAVAAFNKARSLRA